jgi:deazaflavin-dependent oxidoreductase (nitroreductase family)
VRFAGTQSGAWVGAHLLHHLDRLAFRFSGGNRSAAQFLGGIPIITVTITGARSGLPRSIPLNELPDGPNFVLIASNWGQFSCPAWYYNLRANPSVTVTAAGQTAQYLALETQGAERERCWRLAVGIYPGYAAYQRRLERPVPVILLTPQEG